MAQLAQMQGQFGNQQRLVSARKALKTGQRCWNACERPVLHNWVMAPSQHPTAPGNCLRGRDAGDGIRIEEARRSRRDVPCARNAWTPAEMRQSD